LSPRARPLTEAQREYLRKFEAWLQVPSPDRLDERAAALADVLEESAAKGADAMAAMPDTVEVAVRADTSQLAETLAEASAQIQRVLDQLDSLSTTLQHVGVDIRRALEPASDRR
jgi:ABC-type transporter Mla subunit MlaD